jgi:hypothetical protein
MYTWRSSSSSSGLSKRRKQTDYFLSRHGLVLGRFRNNHARAIPILLASAGRNRTRFGIDAGSNKPPKNRKKKNFFSLFLNFLQSFFFYFFSLFFRVKKPFQKNKSIFYRLTKVYLPKVRFEALFGRLLLRILVGIGLAGPC